MNDDRKFLLIYFNYINLKVQSIILINLRLIQSLVKAAECNEKLKTINSTKAVPLPDSSSQSGQTTAKPQQESEERVGDNGRTWIRVFGRRAWAITHRVSILSVRVRPNQWISNFQLFIGHWIIQALAKSNRPLLTRNSTNKCRNSKTEDPTLSHPKSRPPLTLFLERRYAFISIYYNIICFIFCHFVDNFEIEKSGNFGS